MKFDNFKCTFTDKKVQRPNEKATLVTLTGYIPVSIDFLSEISKTPKLSKWLNSQKQVEIHELLFPARLRFQVVGKAIKAEKDEDNPKLGERIAEARAKNKLYRFCMKLLFAMYREYGRTLSSLFHFAMTYQSRHYKENKHLNELLEQL